MNNLTLPEVVDSTMMSDFASCPQKFCWSYIYNIQKESFNEHLSFGGAYARALEVARESIYGAGMSVEEGISRGFVAGLAEYGDKNPPKESKKQPHRLLESLDQYFKDFPAHTDSFQPVQAKDGSLALEHTFALPIPEVMHPETGQPFIYAGRYDMLVKREQGSIFVLDDKTTQAMGASWVNSWELRGQLTGYVWAARQYIGEEQAHLVKGAVVRGMCFLKDDLKTAEVLQVKTDFHVQSWYKQLVRNLLRMVNLWEDGYFDRSYADACSAWGGCPFTQLCTSADPEKWIPVHYAPRDWHPLHGQELKQEILL